MLYWFAPFWLGVYPTTWLFLTVLAVLSFAFYGVVIRHWKLAWRVPLHAAWIGAVLFLAYHETNAAQLGSRLHRQIEARQFQDAAVTLDRMLARNPRDEFRRYQAAILQLSLKNDQRYEELCRELLDNSRVTDNPAFAERAAKACLATSRGLEDRTEAFERAERAIKLGGGHGYLHWFELALGMSKFRSQNWPEAIELLDRCLQAKDRYCSPIAHVYRAMALFQLGKGKQAEHALARADASYAELQRHLQEHGIDSLGPGWHDALIFEMAREEAGDMMGENLPTQGTDP